MRKQLIYILALAALAAACRQKTDKDKTKTGETPNSQISALTTEITNKPLDASLFYKRAKAYDAANNLEPAIRDATEAARLDSMKPDYHYYLAELYMKRPYEKGAITEYQKTVNLDSMRKDVYMKLGILYYNVKDRPNSFKNLNRAIELDESNAEAFFYRGMNYKEDKMAPKALDNFQRAIELKPDYYEAYMQLGIINAARKNRLAADYYSSALKIKPDDAFALYDRGKFYQDIDSFRLAINDYETLLGVQPGHDGANYNLGYINYLKKNYAKAAEYFSKVIEKQPDFAEAWNGRSLCYAAMGKKKLAESDLAKYNELLSKTEKKKK